jgi:hypothetical protein
MLDCHRPGLTHRAGRGRPRVALRLAAAFLSHSTPLLRIVQEVFDDRCKRGRIVGIDEARGTPSDFG